MNSMPNDFPPHSLETLQRIAAQFGRLGATRIYRARVAAAIAAAANSGPISVRFRRPGTVIGIYGQTLGATDAELAGIEVRLQFSGQEDFAIDGMSFETVPLRAIVGDAMNWFPINRRVYEGQDWTTTFFNVTAATTITPTLLFAVLEDKVSESR